MKKLLKVSSIVLAVVMLLSVFAGCTKTETTQTDAPTDGVLKLSALIAAKGDLRFDTTELYDVWLKMCEEHIGKKIELDLQVVPGNDLAEKSKVMLASGDMPDVMILEDGEQIVSYGRQEQLVDINQYKELIPNFSEYMEGTAGGDGAIETPEGNIYAFYYGTANSIATSQANFQYRFDIFEKHNIKIPETFDEFYEAAKKLKEIYPESYPITSEKSPTWYNIAAPLVACNQTSHDFYWTGEEYKFGPLEDEYKEVLMYINKLYNEGLIDPEFTVNTKEQHTKKCLNGTSFMIVNSWGRRAMEMNSNQEANVKWGIAMPIWNGDKQPWGLQMNRDSKKGLFSWGGMVISSKADNREDIIKLLDYQYSDEILELLNWGIEGKHFTVNEEGKKQFVDEIMNAEDINKKFGELGMLTGMTLNPGFGITPQDFDAQYSTLPPVPIYYKGNLNEEDGFYVGVSKCDAADYLPPAEPPLLKLSKEEKDFVSDKISAVRAYVEEMQIKFITGKESFDNWDAYLEHTKSLGDVDAVLDMYNTLAKEAIAKEK